MTSGGIRIGLFGGSFDPVHKGHMQVAGSFLKSNLIDELHLIPTPYPPHRKKGPATSFYHRSKMLKLAFSDYDHVVVNDVEKKLPKPSYTIQTINHLQQIQPENIYFLCIGEDNLATFHKWYKFKNILKKVTLIVAGRPGSQTHSQQKEILERSIFIDHEEIGISSTKIRKELDSGEFVETIPESINGYIKRHNLYAE